MTRFRQLNQFTLKPLVSSILFGGCQKCAFPLDPQRTTESGSTDINVTKEM